MDIKTYEYVSQDILKNKKSTITSNNKNDFYINRLRLAVAIAKTTFTKHPDFSYGLSEALINIIRVETLIKNTSSQKLLLNKDRIDLIRDFSKTTRVGELAQGICFLFAQERLQIPTPCDFVGYFEKKFNKLPKGSTPDFIGVSSTGTYDLIESKGTQLESTVAVARLRESLGQCDKGEKSLIKNGYPNAKRKFGVLTVFDYYNPANSGNSQIHYCDPENETNSTFDSWGLILNYFTAIFKGFTGIKSLSELRDIESETYKLEDNSFKLFRMPLIDENLEIISIPFILHRRLLTFGISERVLELLTSKDNQEKSYFEELEKLSKMKKIAPNNEREILELFDDGTLLRII